MNSNNKSVPVFPTNAAGFGHDPYAYLKDVLTRLPTQKNNAIDERLPHDWKPAISDKV